MLIVIQIAIAEIYKVVPDILRHFRVEMAHDRARKTINAAFVFQSDVIVKVTTRK